MSLKLGPLVERPSATAVSAPPAALPTLNDLFSELGERFETAGAVGLVLIGAPMLVEVERRYGEDARRQCLAALGARVNEISEQRLASNYVVCLADPGFDEVMVLFFRAPKSAGFYRTEMPGFRSELNRALPAHGGQIFYPYLRGPSRLPAGISVEIRNPQFGVSTQLRRLVEHARQDCEQEIENARRASRYELLETILDHQIYSVYEPIVEVSNKTVFAYEALARGPEGSVIHAPVALFKAAEEFDLVFELDCVCRESGLRGAADFPKGTKLFLNIRPSAIHDPAFKEERLIETLELSGLAPSDVVFEISEQEPISRSGGFREMCDYYRALGFEFALDDTGTGYSGLEELLEIEPEYIKIDRSMVSGVDQDPARQDILNAMLQLAEKMGARVIGEGLDTIEELDMLERLGIHFGQGWLFGRATPLRRPGDD